MSECATDVADFLSDVARNMTEGFGCGATATPNVAVQPIVTPLRGASVVPAVGRFRDL